MAYIGRVLGIGVTERGDIAALYAVSGRSEGSKSRLAKIINEGPVKRVTINMLKEPVGIQKQYADLLFYDAMWMTAHMNGDVPCGCKPCLVVSNGDHTKEIVNARMKNPEISGLEQVLKEKGPERDAPIYTARIAGEVIFNYSQPYSMFMNPRTKIGMMTKHKELPDVVDIELEDDKEGTFNLISTYTGQSDENPEAPRSEGKDITKKIELKGAHANELAEEFYNMIDPKYVTCVAVAVWFSNGNGWDVAVKNLHGAKA